MFLTRVTEVISPFLEFPSQSPQIGSMFLTKFQYKYFKKSIALGRNPLKSGQCFLLVTVQIDEFSPKEGIRRNPLKSGQCFLHK